jgi:type VI secretion system secreted protein VgrG
MSTYAQAERPMEVATPLGEDALLLVGLSGVEAISRLFRFQLDLLAENGTAVPFDQLLGRGVSVKIRLSDGTYRDINGICSRLDQGARDETFTSYRMEVVPTLWFLTRRGQSRIFQRLSIPDILKEVLAGTGVEFRLKGTYHPRDYCVQYRETDFQFASRLMEEEGLYYFFRHTKGSHQMVVADTPEGHPDLSGTKLFDEVRGGNRTEDRILTWKKTQELRPHKYTLWDHCFELPHQTLAAEDLILDSVQVGPVTHPMKLGRAEMLELFDYPGEYAQRFDGDDTTGARRDGELDKIFEDNRRTVHIRMQEQAVAGLEIHGTSDLSDLASGHRFRLEGRYDADGPYVLTEVHHSARLIGDYHNDGSDVGWTYSNSFTCIPAGLPYRPRRTTPKPIIPGTQTAVVVGPPGEEICTDQYGRVKVQFHWDRQGQHDLGSSCWIRVAQIAAGGGFGAIHIPRVGQEVVVQFEEGDPDRPIITGCVYNPGQMPPYPLPAKKMVSGLKSNSYPGGGGDNEITVDDTKGNERMFIHAQYNQDTVVGNDRTAKVGHDSTDQVGHDQTVQVGHDLTIKVANIKSESVGVLSEENVGVAKKIVAGKNVLIAAGTSITLKCGASLIHMNQAGVIVIQGTMINVIGAINTNVTAPLTTISGAAVFTGGLLTVSAGGIVNKVMGGTTTVDGGPVKINCG